MPTRTRLAAAALGASAVAAIPSAVVASTYVVRPGDSLGDIATRHGTTASALQQANNLSGDSVRVGQLLAIPDQRVALPAYTQHAADTESHSVRAGEGVFEVARRYGVDPTALARHNGIGVNTPLREGVELSVPGRLARMSALLNQVAADLGMTPALVSAVAWVESEWRQDVTSPTGAVGVMQLEPYAGDWVSRHLAGRRLNLWEARENVLAGVLLLRHLVENSAGETDAALGAYYQGQASLAAHGAFDDTAQYVRRVNALLETAS
ncbi:MAG TPA: LysM peptidoglycan-binding domain-containing protein [Candidatus Dormibacteraeota bacterium]|nr:LysM peptidoglycan-binding domain-containing protein [Candidatus Dormibacteraeota bacterium]